MLLKQRERLYIAFLLNFIKKSYTFYKKLHRQEVMCGLKVFGCYPFFKKGNEKKGTFLKKFPFKKQIYSARRRVILAFLMPFTQSAVTVSFSTVLSEGSVYI